MSELQQILDNNFELLFYGSLLWVLLWIGVSVIYRRARGKAIYPLRPEGSLYYEGSASGRSNKNIFTRIGMARHCLQVAVTPDCLIIQPRFPFNLMFLPEMYGLEYRVPLPNIRTVDKNDGGLLGDSVDVSFVDPDRSGIESVTLYLKNMDDFITTLGRMRQ